MSPLVTFLILLVIGILAGFIFDRLAGPGWLSRQVAGATRTLVTSALVGVAGSFVGFHLAVLLGLAGVTALIGAVLGAGGVLYGWRMVR